jgi:hypothetical protein
MSNVHPFLRGKANIFIIALWGLAAVAALFLGPRPFPFGFLVIGACCGAFGGFMQLRSIAESKTAFLHSESVFGVDRALKATTWGTLYLIYLWLCIACFFLVGYLYYRRLLVGAVPYFAMAFVRECVTLRASFALEAEAKTALDPTARARADEATCMQCGGVFSTQDMIAHGGHHVCARCKPVFLQKLAEGVAVPPPSVEPKM